jgi:hypothetical protein
MPNPPETATLPVRWVKAFGRFWWDFLVGDTPELFVATVLIVIITAVLAKTVSTTVAWVTMPILVVAALVASVWRGRH